MSRSLEGFLCAEIEPSPKVSKGLNKVAALSGDDTREKEGTVSKARTNPRLGMFFAIRHFDAFNDRQVRPIFSFNIQER